MIDVPTSLAHFHARQRPAAHKHAHRQHTLQGEGTQAGGWGVGVPDCTFFEPGGPSQRGRVASSASSARRARPHINLQAFGRRATCQLGHHQSSKGRPRGLIREARGRQGCDGEDARGADCMQNTVAIDDARRREQRGHVTGRDTSARHEKNVASKWGSPKNGFS